MRASLRASWLMAMLIAVLLIMAVRSGRAGCAGTGCRPLCPAATGTPSSRVTVGRTCRLGPGFRSPPCRPRTRARSARRAIGSMLGTVFGFRAPLRRRLPHLPRVATGTPDSRAIAGPSFAQDGDLAVQALQAANPAKVRPGNVIYAGESLWNSMRWDRATARTTTTRTTTAPSSGLRLFLHGSAGR